MSDFLARLVARGRGQEARVEPLIAPRFAQGAELVEATRSPARPESPPWAPEPGDEGGGAHSSAVPRGGPELTLAQPARRARLVEWPHSLAAIETAQAPLRDHDRPGTVGASPSEPPLDRAKRGERAPDRPSAAPLVSSIRPEHVSEPARARETQERSATQFEAPRVATPTHPVHGIATVEHSPANVPVEDQLPNAVVVDTVPKRVSDVTPTSEVALSVAPTLPSLRDEPHASRHSSSADVEPGVSRMASEPPASVHVTIGRVEVWAAPPVTRSLPARRASEPTSLADFLNRRPRGGG